MIVAEKVCIRRYNKNIKNNKVDVFFNLNSCAAYIREKNNKDPNKNISIITDGDFVILLAIIPTNKKDIVIFNKL